MSHVNQSNLIRTFDTIMCMQTRKQILHINYCHKLNNWIESVRFCRKFPRTIVRQAQSKQPWRSLIWSMRWSGCIYLCSRAHRHMPDQCNLMVYVPSWKRDWATAFHTFDPARQACHWSRSSCRCAELCRERTDGDNGCNIDRFVSGSLWSIVW